MLNANVQEDARRLAKSVDKLSQMCQFPKFYLSNYFSDLKSQVDKNMATQFMQSPQNTDLLPVWTEIINRIEKFEKLCLTGAKTAKTNLMQTFKRLDSIRQANDPSLVKREEFQLQKLLFQNKSIVFLSKTSNNETDNKVNEPASFDSKLIIINDEFIGNTMIRSLASKYKLFHF